MKTTLLKYLRKKTWSEYEVRKDYGQWYIYISHNKCLAYTQFKTKEKAIAYAKSLWHEEAQKYLWEHRGSRK